MSDRTKIEWTDVTWNPATGCTKVSRGCDNCYIDRTPPFRMAGRRFAKPCGDSGCSGHDYLGDGPGATTGLQLHEDRLGLPLRWRRPRRIFVNSMSDLFHKDVPDEFIARVFAVMALAPQHTFQVLTKRHARMRALLNSSGFAALIEDAADLLNNWNPQAVLPEPMPWPLPNVWLGVSVEDQAAANLRIPALLETPAAVRWLSCEPLLGPVDLTRWTQEHAYSCGKYPEPPWCTCGRDADGYLDWVVAGGESGPGARPMHPDWARSIRDQCVAAGVPFHFKQWGEWAPYRGTGSDSTVISFACSTQVQRVGKTRAGRVLDGRTWDEYPGAEVVIRRNRVKVWRSRLAGRWLIACADCEPYARSTFAEAIAWATDHATNHNPRTTA